MASTPLLLVLLTLLTAVPFAESQELTKQVASPRFYEASADYELGPGDLMSINVSGVKEFAQSVRVSNSGRVRVPYVGIIFVAGMTTVAVEAQVARLIREHELVSEPVVRVQVDEYRARPTYVVGAVNAPGQFVITGEMYLLDLLSKAGGLLPGAAEAGFLYRRFWPLPTTDARVIGGASAQLPPPAETLAVKQPASRVPGDPERTGENVIRIPFEELRKGTKPELNVRLQGGDILYVPRRRPQNIYIIGDVLNPGSYELPRTGVSAAQAIILTGGPLKTAKMSKAFLLRYDAAGARQVMPVNFTDIIDGKQKDVLVRADDIIYVPNSGAKTIGLGLLDMIPRLVQQWLIF